MAESDPSAFEIAYRREKAARLQAEKLLEDSSRELYFKNRELEEANKNLKKNQQQLVQQEKMASVGLLASGIAHEINNPLGYSLSNMTVLSEYADDLTKLLSGLSEATDLDQVRALLQDENIQHILADLPELVRESVEGLESVRQIVGDIRAFARSGEAGPMDADINDGIRATLNVLKTQLKNRFQVHVNYGDLPPVRCLIGKLNQVFANIIINATQASGENGSIYIDTALEDGQVVIEISDDGPGIREDHLAEVFSPFFTTKPVGEGTGLGLSICYTIITEDHSGSLTVANGAGRGCGAMFRISIPADPEQRETTVSAGF